MRSIEIAIFVICINVATVLVAGTGAFGTGPHNVIDTSKAVWYTAIGIIVGGGITILGWSFKTPLIVSAFALAYAESVVMLNLLLVNIFTPVAESDPAVASVFIGALDGLLVIIGVIGAIQLASGPLEGGI